MDPEALSADLLRRWTAHNVEHALVCLDPDGVIVGWNGGAEQVLGYTAAEAVGRRGRDLFVPEDLAKGLDVHELEVARHDSSAEDDRWHLRKDGTRIWVTGAVEAVRDADGRLLGFVKVLRDRTDIHTWTTAVLNERDGTREAHERTSQFLRTLGHEMRNPLAPLQNVCAILPRLHPDPKTAQLVGIVQAQVNALRRMAEDLMEVSRIGAGQVAMHLERADLRELAARAATMLEPQARGRGLKLEAILPAGPLPVLVDPERFQQVVFNLVGNAIKYTQAGGSVWIKATQEAREVLLRVEDTGIGIAPEVLPRIFDLFSREQAAQQTDPGGLGIGLAVVRELVQLHNGTVQARSPGPGKGSEFTVRLPAAPDT